MKGTFLYLSVLMHEAQSLQIHPRYPMAQQPSWQASVPDPVHITYDVANNGHWDEDPTLVSDFTGGSSTNFAQSKLENTSFALSPERLITQAVTPEQVSIRLHAPTETLQQSLDGVSAVEELWAEDDQEATKRYSAGKQQLFDAMSMNMRRIVRQSLAPLSHLRNPQT